jgi:hypothetical protein
MLCLTAIPALGRAFVEDFGANSNTTSDNIEHSIGFSTVQQPNAIDRIRNHRGTLGFEQNPPGDIDIGCVGTNEPIGRRPLFD